MEASHARHCHIVVIPLSSPSCFLVRVDVGLGSLSARYTLTERRIADAASACRQNDTLSLSLSLSFCSNGSGDGLHGNCSQRGVQGRRYRASIAPSAAG